MAQTFNGKVIADQLEVTTLTDDVAADNPLAATVFRITNPIGTIYMSVKNRNPASYYQKEASTEDQFTGVCGTWIRWGNGRVPVGVDETQTEFNAAENTSGEKTVTLTVATMPGHEHNIVPPYGSGALLALSDGNLPAGSDRFYINIGGTTSDSSRLLSTNHTGNNRAHNNLQPYITTYMWKRTA